MHITQNLEVAELLLEKGAAVNAVSDCGNLPLHMKTSMKIAGLLVDNGASIGT